MPLTLSPPPRTLVEPITDTLHGVSITDPYRWLEDQNSLPTRQWLEEQRVYLRAYFDSLPDLQLIRPRVSELLSSASTFSQPWNVAGTCFYLRRFENSQQPSIVARTGPLGKETILVDPARRATGPSTSVAVEAISEDGRFLAYSVRQGGTDHAAVEILDIQNKSVIADSLPEGFCTGLAFAPDGSGFYYSHRELHDPRPNYSAVFAHCFGTNRSEDKELFVAGEKPGLFVRILSSREANFLVYAVFSTGKRHSTSVYVHCLSSGSAPDMLLQDIEGVFFPFFVGGQLLAFTDFGAPNFRIVQIDLSNPGPKLWRNIVPESDRRIQKFAIAHDQVFVTRIDRFSTRLDVFDCKGKWKNEIPLASGGTADLLNQTTTTDYLFYSYSSVSQPPTTYCYDAREKKTVTWEEANTPSNPSVIAIEEAVYPSKDGASIPLFLAARKELLNSGPLPTFLTGYGGFGTCVTPRFTAFATFLIEQGVLLAVPALRGGSELGEEWHMAGKRGNRQNSFDDLIAAAEWLLVHGFSVPGRIAVGGGSHAGLLVGAAITQRPDLFRAAICLGPLLDMIRYHLFDFAARWADEYGTPDDEQDFHSLLGYSPYHHVREGVEYPAVMFISGDADTRCNPMHSRKMAARMQAASRSRHPILLDYKPMWGHMPVQPLSMKVDALTDRLAFLCHELGVSVQTRRSS